MADAFEQIFGQPQVREFLRRSVASDHVVHAYLFTGPAGSNKTQAAYSLAMTMLCAHKGCMKCDTCSRVKKRQHPDLHYFAPEGANGYLVEQIRSLIEDTQLAPIMSKHSVYILDRVDLMSPSCANALLKTLEEPPGHVIFILLGRTRESVLGTIVSRCSVVPFRNIPASQAAAILSQHIGSDPRMSKIAIEACGGSITKARDFLKSDERLSFRLKVMETLTHLRRYDSWDLIERVAELVKDSKAPLDVLREHYEQDLMENADFFEHSTIKLLEKKQKRELSAKTIECIKQICYMTSSYLRDVLMICSGVSNLVINYDIVYDIEEVSSRVDTKRAVSALRLVDDCIEAISYNVSPETALDALFFEIRKVLYDKPHSS